MPIAVSFPKSKTFPLRLYSLRIAVSFPKSKTSLLGFSHCRLQCHSQSLFIHGRLQCFSQSLKPLLLGFIHCRLQCPSRSLKPPSWAFLIADCMCVCVTKGAQDPLSTGNQHDTNHLGGCLASHLPTCQAFTDRELDS